MAERKNTRAAAKERQADAEEPQDSGTSEETGTAAEEQKAAKPAEGTAPKADDHDRMPSHTVVDTDAGPLVPTDVQNVRKPELGHRNSSTNPVSAAAALNSVPGSNHVRLVDDDDNDVAIDDLFETKEPNDPSMFVTVRRRVYQEYTPYNATTTMRHLLYPKGARLTVAEVERVKAALRSEPQNR